MKAVIVGGGAGGLLTGLLLARDGHDVTVLERDPERPPSDREAAWDSWTRTGISQIRQPHGFIGRTRRILMDELPDLWDDMQGSDAYRVDLRRFAPDPAALNDQDERLQVEVMRRTTFDRLLGLRAEAESNLTVLRGVVVTGLNATNGSSVPTVTGVSTEAHGHVSADLVIDSGGRRTASPRWLADLGVPVEQWSETDGFTYHSMWFRTHDGSYPPDLAGFFGGSAPGLVSLLFAGDTGVFGVAMVGLGSDKPLRKLRDPDRFVEVARRFGPLAGWVDPDVASPITEVMPMGAIQNRSLRFWNGEGPSAYGIVNVGDSVLSTNPSLGRGIAIALVGAVELRTVIREVEDPKTVTTTYDTVKQEQIVPWLWDAVESDRGMRLALNTALGSPTDEPESDRTLLSRASFLDMACWRRWAGVNQVFELPSTCLEDEELMDRARSIAAQAPPPAYNLSREELEAILA